MKTIIKTKQGHFYIQKAIFNSIFSPFWIARKELDKNIKELSKKLTGKVLDIGAGSKPYKKYFTDYTSLEVEGKEADYNYKGKFPFNDNEFDSAICTQVLEHIFEPELFLGEINRVLKRGGKLLLTVPFVWDEHEQPYDYARYSSFGLSYLLGKYFKVIEIRKTGDFSLMFQLLLMIFYKHNKKLTLMLTLPINIISQLFRWKIKDFYLDNVFMVKKQKI